MKQIVITDHLKIEPRYLGSDLRETIHSLLLLKRGNFSKNKGYIIDIIEIISMDNFISAITSEIIFEVVFKASVLMPEIGSEYEAVIEQIFENKELIVANVQGIFKVFLHNYNTLAVGDKVTLKIQSIRYSATDCILLGSVV
jgi:DNA-directed RNA polymerase subunit E'/Rpb7